MCGMVGHSGPQRGWTAPWQSPGMLLGCTHSALGNQCRGCYLMGWPKESSCKSGRQETFDPLQLVQVPLKVGNTAHGWPIRLGHVTQVYLHPPMTSFVGYLRHSMCCLGMRWLWSSLPHGLIWPHNQLLTSHGVSIYTMWYFGVLACFLKL